MPVSVLVIGSKSEPIDPYEKYTEDKVDPTLISCLGFIHRDRPEGESVGTIVVT